MAEQTIADVSRLYIRPGDQIRVALEQISVAARAGLPGGIALVVDEEERLVGVVTDGDVRRGLLNGCTLDDTIATIYTSDPIVFSHTLSYKQILEEIPGRLVEKGRYRGGVMEKIILVDDMRRAQKVLNFVDLWRNQRALHRQVAVVGMGYVGLTLAVTLADAGFQVKGVENNDRVRAKLGKGEPHFHEVGLEPLLRHHLDSRLRIVAEVPKEAEIYVLSIATPVRDGKIDLSHLRAAVAQVGGVLSYDDLVVMRSTCPVGTCRNEVLPMLEKASGLKGGRDFYLAFAPERTLEGRALDELRSLPQVIGGFDQNSVDMTASLFREISPLVITVSSLEAAELVKLVNNSFRDLRFAYANELAMVCERYNLDTVEVVRAANKGYPRDPVPVPSPGVGGACLIKDPYIYAHAAREAGLEDALSLHGRRVNEAMPQMIVAKVLRELERLGKDPSKARFFLMGFAFKGEPETSDMRHSTALDVLRLLQPVAGTIRGYDPVVDPAEIAALGVKTCTLADGFAGADCALLLNNHRSFADLDIFGHLAAMNRPAIYCDTWHMFAPEDVLQIDGITYLGLGFRA